jgi:hypothetical protein
MEAMQKLSRDRLNACNILADSLRNAITKSGLIFTLVKQEIGHLREQWEQLLLKDRNESPFREEGIKKLNGILREMDDCDGDLRENLAGAHDRFLGLSLTPDQGERWVEMQIEERWNEILREHDQGDEKRQKVRQTIDKLKDALRFGLDPAIIDNFDKMPEDLKMEWVDIIYENMESLDNGVLDRLIDILGDDSLNIPSQEKSRKALVNLRALAETMNQLERNTNFLLHQVLNGNGSKEGNLSRSLSL